MNRSDDQIRKKRNLLFNAYNSQEPTSPLKGVDPRNKYERLRNEYLQERSKSRKNDKNINSLKRIIERKAGKLTTLRSIKNEINGENTSYFGGFKPKERRNYGRKIIEEENSRNKSPGLKVLGFLKNNSNSFKTETKKKNSIREEEVEKTVKKLTIQTAYDRAIEEQKESDEAKKKKKSKKKKKKKKDKKNKKLKLKKFNPIKFKEKIEKNINFVLKVLEGVKVEKKLEIRSPEKKKERKRREDFEELR